MINQCQSIEKGMTFWNPSDHSELWEVVKFGDSFVRDGKTIKVSNWRRNKWHCRRKGTDDPLILFCFDVVFDPYEYNFQKP